MVLIQKGVTRFVDEFDPHDEKCYTDIKWGRGGTYFSKLL